MTLLPEKDGVDAPKWSDADVDARVKQAAEAADATPEAMYNMGAWLKSKGRAAEAGPWFEKAAAGKPNFDKAIAALGLVLVQEGRLPEAEAKFDAAMKIDPANAIANAFRAARSLSKKSYTDAINMARDGLVSDPDSHDAYAVLAAAYLEMGLIDAGLLVARNALSLDAADGQIENLMGIMFGKQNEVRQAVKMFSKATTDSPEIYEAWMNLGLVTLGYKDLKTAGDSFDRALALKPTSRDARLSKAIVLRGSNQGQESLKILKGLAGERADADVHFNMCLLYQENLSQEEKALDECSTFVSMIPADHPKRKEVERRIEGIKITIEALRSVPPAAPAAGDEGAAVPPAEGGPAQ
jgi:Tfp pilus assembly protein PilF